MNDLKAELAEAEAKHEAVYDDIVSLEANRDKIEAFIKATKAKIADAEVTYSIGDRFELFGHKRMLVFTEGRVHMIGLDNGCWQVNNIEVSDVKRITQKEFDIIRGISDYTRYWDNRKQQKVSE